MMGKRRRVEALATLVVAALWTGLFFLPSDAFAQPSPYKGESLTLISGRSPGGLGEMRIRAFLPFLTKHIPGNPTIVLQPLPGAGGRKAANYLYNQVRPDGFTVANIGAGFVANAILGEPGVKYDVDKVIYLGSGNSNTSYVFGTRREAGFDSLEKLRAAKGVRIAAMSVGHDIYIIGRLFAWLMDLKEPRFVTGYSGPEADLAVMRGEVDGRANTSGSVLTRSPDWANKGLVNFHSVEEIPKGFRERHPAFDPLPALESFTKTDLERKVLAMHRTLRLIGSPYILPPGVPKGQADALKEAFRGAFKDPQLPKAWRKLTGEDPYPLLPEEQLQAVREVPRDPEVIKVFKRLAAAGPLPPR